jgi:hypothetical protein
VQSAKRMLQEERVLPAWIMQYPLRWRRASSPRIDGVVQTQQMLTKRLMRFRRKLNTHLTKTGKPVRKYTDHSTSNLQFYHGSAVSAGYDRHRRIHKTRSKKNR